jgi:dinuclear metal center YbgI/SA1388 family protein
MRVDEVIEYLDNKLQAKRFKDDRKDNGILIKGKKEVNKIATATNTSIETINKVIKEKVNFLIVHHSSWEWADQDNREKKLKLLERNGISLYVSHDAMDCVTEIGMGDTLAKLFGIKVEGRFADWNILPWSKKEDNKRVKDVYVGVYGTLKKEMNFEDFVDLVEKKLGCKIDSWKCKDKVKKIGIITGGGLESMWVKEAKELGCDTYLSGQTKMFAVLYGIESGLNIVSATHYATESIGMKGLVNIIKKDLGLDVIFIKEINTG